VFAAALLFASLTPANVTDEAMHFDVGVFGGAVRSSPQLYPQAMLRGGAFARAALEDFSVRADSSFAPDEFSGIVSTSISLEMRLVHHEYFDIYGGMGPSLGLVFNADPQKNTIAVNLLPLDRGHGPDFIYGGRVSGGFNVRLLPFFEVVGRSSLGIDFVDESYLDLAGTAEAGVALSF
jgi:hypothetical protein